MGSRILANSSSTASVSIDTEVRRLLVRSNLVDERFQRIKVALTEFGGWDHFHREDYHADDDKSALVSFQGDEDRDSRRMAQKLLPTWVKYQERFLSLCEVSSAAATRARNNAHMFSKTILPTVLSETTSIAEKHGELTRFFQQMVVASDRGLVEKTARDKEIPALKDDIQTFLEKSMLLQVVRGHHLDEDMKYLSDDINA
ncbi:hypothetical protein DXG03_002733 [Asterophora parasitica]|uniref:Uncharacterized protein n=1 Tax=Asterophora parasitica TaxID=117018 RepID=A0A9P7G5G9_9AGAR|nr:hypothetical protein DXG03_002733 [Asterophora parasitica]